VREPPGAAPEEVFRSLQVALGLRSRIREGGERLLHKREVVLRRGIERARVVLRCARNCPLQIRLRLGVASVLRKSHAHRKVGLGIVWVDFKRALVIWLRVDQSVMELIEAKSDLVGELGARVFLRLFRILHLRRQLHVSLRRNGRVGEEHLAGRIGDGGCELLVLRGGIDLHGLAPRRIRIDGDVALGEDAGRGTRPRVPAVARDARPYRNPHRAALQHARGVEADEQLVVCETVHVHSSVDRHVLDAADSLHREPELLDLARLVRRDPRVVRLVVRPAADHQLEIRSVVVREHLVPHVRLGEVAPEEELLADSDVAVRDVRSATLLFVVVSRHERVVGIKAEY